MFTTYCFSFCVALVGFIQGMLHDVPHKSVGCEVDGVDNLVCVHAASVKPNYEQIVVCHNLSTDNLVKGWFHRVLGDPKYRG